MASCSWFGPNPITIINQTDETIGIWSLTSGGGATARVGAAAGRETVIYQEECLGLVAFTDRREVASIDLLCLDDPPWVVTEPAHALEPRWIWFENQTGKVIEVWTETPEGDPWNQWEIFLRDGGP